jgi:hypothetical protein
MMATAMWIKEVSIRALDIDSDDEPECDMNVSVTAYCVEYSLDEDEETNLLDHRLTFRQLAALKSAVTAGRKILRQKI